MIRTALNPENHSVKYAYYEYMNTFHLMGLEYSEMKAMGHGIWDQYPSVSPARRHPHYIFESTQYPPDKGDDILDVGCGLGGLMFQCAKTFPEVNSITGIDLEEENIRYCNEYNPYPDKVNFFATNAAELSTTDNEILKSRVEKKFHKIYFIEVSPEIPLEIFKSIFDQCFKALHKRGILTLVVLTVDGKPKGNFENQVYAVVDPKAPTFKDIQEIISSYDCEVAYKNVTEISIGPFQQWHFDNYDIVKDAYLWPFPFILKKSFEGIKALIERGIYQQHDIYIKKL